MTEAEIKLAQEIHDMFWFRIMQKPVSNQLMQVIITMLIATFIRNLLANKLIEECDIEAYLKSLMEFVDHLSNEDFFEAIVKQ